MRKLSVLFVVLALIGVFLLSACSSETSEADADQTDMLVAHTIYLDADATDMTNKVRDFEVRLVGDINFFPTTYEVNVGDTVRFSFAFDESHYVSIEDLGVGSKVKKEILEFVPTESGVFEMVCVDCDPVAFALITVN